jgi:hypothetical protein
LRAAAGQGGVGRKKGERRWAVAQGGRRGRRWAVAQGGRRGAPVGGGAGWLEKIPRERDKEERGRE